MILTNSSLLKFLFILVPDPSSKKSSQSSLATYFDIAIIRTLFSPSWSIDGYLWCLEYLLQRLTSISHQHPCRSSRKSSSTFHLTSTISSNPSTKKSPLEHLDLSTPHLHLLNPSVLLSNSTLTRSNQSRLKILSHSDSQIHYKHLEILPECPGSIGYIHSNGTINFNVILAGIHAIICKEYHLKIYQLVLNILDLLFNFNILSSNNDEKFQLAIDIILR